MAAFFGRFLAALIVSVVGLILPLTAAADAGSVKIGVVLMHGKGGLPAKHVSDLASSLREQGLLVANLEMAWSGRRDYDVDVGTAEGEVTSALGALRDKGAKKLFVAGHSQGGLFALYFGGKHAVDGVIAIAPGGNVAAPIFRKNLRESLDAARKLVAEGKGGEKASLMDFESSRGTYPVLTTASIYLTWFDPDGAMNQMKAMRSMNPAVPVLYIAPTNDYPGLRGIKQQMFDALPKNTHTKLYEPSASHLGAPSASAREIAEWTSEVASAHYR